MTIYSKESFTGNRRITIPTRLLILLGFLCTSSYLFYYFPFTIKPLHCPSSNPTIFILPSSSSSSNPTTEWFNNLTELDFDSTTTGSFEGSSLQEVCDKVQWVNKRWMTCDGIEGGIGNVRNALLHCLRYTIAAGSGLVMPSLSIRGEVGPESSLLHQGGRAGIDFYFDLIHFKSTLNQFCPALIIVDSIYNIPEFHTAFMPQPLQPRDLFSRATGKPAYHQEMINDHAITFRKDFDKVMADPGPTIYHPMTYREELFPLTGRPTIIRLAWPIYFEYPISLDSYQFQKNFGLILKFKPEVRYLATEIFNHLTSTSSIKFPTGKYFGCHLRSENDAPLAFWTSVESQKKNFLVLAEAKKLNAIYVAGGDEAGFQTFEKEGAEVNIRLVNKQSILSPSSLIHLKALPFDQQAMVDYLVLLKSNYFSGIGASSFSHNIAIRRHLNAVGAGNVKKANGGNPFTGVDQFSMIMGAENYQYIPLTTWP